MKRSTARIFPLVTILALAAAHPSSSKTWYVAHDGTGDAPTIHAALDSSMAGDSVLVGPGEYEIDETIQVLAGIVLISEEGPLLTRIVRPPVDPPLFGVDLVGDSELHGFWVDRFNLESVGEGLGSTIKNNIIGSSTEIPGYAMDVYRECTIEGNLFTAKSYLNIRVIGVTFQQNIVLAPKDFVGYESAFVVCNDFFGEGSEEVLTLHPYNFSVDPLFCPGTYTLQSTSPILPPATGQCGVIGPLPVGCGAVSVEERTWGEIKGMYRR